jgi:Ca2+-dependent lipid-binding protein
MLHVSLTPAPDDLVGRVTIPLSELMAKPNTMVPYTSTLQGFEDANSMPGTLFWSVGYYEKSALNQDLKKEPSPNVPKEVKEKDPKTREEGTVADTQDEKDALRVPPDPAVPSGVLSVIIHQINNLERQGACARGHTRVR